MLTAKERKIHDEGLVWVLKQIHEGLDADVFEAYGWPPDPVVDLQVFGIPEAISRVVRLALSKCPDGRWPDLATLQKELDQVQRTTKVPT